MKGAAFAVFINEPNNPADFFTYVAHGQFNDVEAPLWVYVDTDIMEVPEGTMGLSFTLEHPLEVEDPSNPDLIARTDDDIWTFDKPIDVAQWHNYFRLEHWPRNVFRSLQCGGLNTRRSTGTELLDDAAQVYYYEVEYDPLHEEFDASTWPRDPHTAFRNFVVPHLRGPRTFTIRDTHWSRPASLSRVIASIESGGSELPLWVFNSPDEVEFFYDFQETGTAYLTDVGNFYGEGFDHQREGDVGYMIPYYHDASWPTGLARLVDNYRYEGNTAQVAPHVLGARTGAVSRIIEPARLGIDYVRNADMRGALSVEDNILYSADFDGSPQDWWTWPSDGMDPTKTIHIMRITGETVSTWVVEAGLVDRSCSGADLPPDQAYMTNSTVTHSLYRHERWADNVWSSAWNADGSPTYGPDAMGVGHDEPDESTCEDPISDPESFSFQTWVKFANWHPTACDHGAGRHVWVGDGDYPGSLFFSGARQNMHCWTNWNNATQEYGAVYYRRRHFPDGVYRRMDNFSVVGNGDSGIRRGTHDDEPELSECGAPWHSAYFRDWVAAMSAEIGRPIYSDPLQGAPWIRVWDPEHTENESAMTVTLEGNHVLMTPGHTQELPVGYEERALDHLSGDQSYHFATKYRTGIDLHFDPCSARYASGGDRAEGCPDNPLWLYLKKIEPWLRNYRDPDVVLDIADSLFRRVETKRNSFQGTIDTKERQIEDLQIRLSGIVGEIAETYKSMAYYEGLSLQGYRATLERNRALITRHGSLSHEGSVLTLTMNVFEIQGQALGPMKIKVTTDRNTFACTVHPVRGCENLGQHGHVHPHVDSGRTGQICWGDGVSAAAALAKGIDPLEFIFATAEFLKTGYNPPDAHCRIGQWHRVETYWCEPCEDDHPQGSACPNVCQRCNQQVNWDEHGTCEEDESHCWSYNDSDSCPACESEQAGLETGAAHNHAAGDASAAE